MQIFWLQINARHHRDKNPFDRKSEKNRENSRFCVFGESFEDCDQQGVRNVLNGWTCRVFIFIVDPRLICSLLNLLDLSRLLVLERVVGAAPDDSQQIAWQSNERLLVIDAPIFVFIGEIACREAIPDYHYELGERTYKPNRNNCDPKVVPLVHVGLNKERNEHKELNFTG